MLKPYISKQPRVTTNYFTSKQLATIYKFPPPSNVPVTIGVMSFGGGLYGNIDSNGFLTSGDVHQYWKYQEINQIPKVIVRFVDGGTNNPSDDIDATTENILDISVIGSCCPSSNLTIILFIFKQSSTLTNAFQTMLRGINVQGIQYVPSIISVSWGAPEIYFVQGSPADVADLDGVNNVLQMATSKGINICVAAGDFGSTDGTSELSVDFPSSCPYVTSVGGTTLHCPTYSYDDNSTREVVWNNGKIQGIFYGTGGGISRHYSKPSYQEGFGIDSFRNVPDIALNADPYTGIFLYVNNKLKSGIGGTSMSAPMFAAYLACLGTVNTFVNPILYANMNCFHDIIIGNNDDRNLDNIISYAASSGYDCCSGLGSIDGSKLTRVLNPLISLTVHVTSVFIPNTNITTGSPYQYTPVILPLNATNKLLKWSSSNNSIVTVSSNGKLKGIKNGTATITCTTTDGTELSSYSFITVTTLVKYISMKIPTVLYERGARQYKPIVLPLNATNKILNWYSNNTNVATVNSNGVVKGISRGQARITCRTMDGSNVSVQFVVKILPKIWMNFKSTISN
jgi:subtilase family serine protease